MMHKHRVIGGPVYAGSHIINVELANPSDLPIGTLLAIDGDTIIPATTSHTALGVLMQSHNGHVSVGISGVFNVRGEGTAGRCADAGRALILSTFMGLDSDGSTCPMMQILL
ncbi:hypothetical protein PVA45_07825 (plasmid) [Entomospira entomophila]|uniref:Uncharacterized protein n=1 Tax=Entomospira entomophila TaxID=2719988 RepID=A0A968GAB1_9SPIO|nr:hypothetical protein [Entomospira entomophilus]NIZ41412.1 hypothetical protein [Entomospira entomophilus]WDI36362.1 hypothetical protein PVA45_07825 [Entomospira entomophilus]